MMLTSAWIESLPEDLRLLAHDWLAAQPLRAEYENRRWQRLRIEWNDNSNHTEETPVRMAKLVHWLRVEMEMPTLGLLPLLARLGEFFGEALRGLLRLGQEAASRLIELDADDDEESIHV